MSIRLMDEIYAAIHNGELPPFTNARKKEINIHEFIIKQGFIPLSDFLFLKYGPDDVVTYKVPTHLPVILHFPKGNYIIEP